MASDRTGCPTGSKGSRDGRNRIRADGAEGMVDGVVIDFENVGVVDVHFNVVREILRAATSGSASRLVF
jgi:hypothetical protein